MCEEEGTTVQDYYFFFTVSDFKLECHRILLVVHDDCVPYNLGVREIKWGESNV